jgi:hypothetical protein
MWWMAIGVALSGAGLIMIVAWITNETGLPVSQHRDFICGAIINIFVGIIVIVPATAAYRLRRWGQTVLECLSWLAAIALTGVVGSFAFSGMSDFPTFFKVLMVITAPVLPAVSGFTLHMMRRASRPAKSGFPVVMPDREPAKAKADFNRE